MISLYRLDIYAVVANFAKPFEGNFKLWCASNLLLMVRDPDDLKIILNCDECFNKPDILYKPFVKFGMFVMRDERYKAHRRLILPIFSPRALQSYLPTINIKAKEFLKRFDSKLESTRPFDIYHSISDFTLDSILMTLLGVIVREEVRHNIVRNMEM